MTKFGTPIGAGAEVGDRQARVGVGRGAVGVAVGAPGPSARGCRRSPRRLRRCRSPWSRPGLRVPRAVDLAVAAPTGAGRARRCRRSSPRGRRRVAAGGGRSLAGVVVAPSPPAWWSSAGRRRRRRRRAARPGLGGVERAGAVGVVEVRDAVAVVVGEVRALRAGPGPGRGCRRRGCRSGRRPRRRRRRCRRAPAVPATTQAPRTARPIVSRSFLLIPSCPGNASCQACPCPGSAPAPPPEARRKLLVGVWLCNVEPAGQPYPNRADEAHGHAGDAAARCIGSIDAGLEG